MDEVIKQKPQFKLDVVTGVRMTTDEWSYLVTLSDKAQMKPSALIRKIIKSEIDYQKEQGQL